MSFPIQNQQQSARIWGAIEQQAFTQYSSHPNISPEKIADLTNQTWGWYASHQYGNLPALHEFMDRSSTNKGQLAIDLGCGNGLAATLPLLRKEWNVIAVDSSQLALDHLKRSLKRDDQNFDHWISSGQLKIIQKDVTDFKPDHPADLVVANDVLPYIEPSKFHETWTKIHDICVKKGGVFVGNFIYSIENPEIMRLVRMNAWALPNGGMVRPLLEETGYEVEVCRERIGDMPQMSIEFTAKKI